MSAISDPTPINHQTVRLTRGAHASPAQGVCVMELASMLAGGSFTDRPHSACPVIGGFLREYNDAVDDARRQDLYRCAAEVLGTRATAATERARVARCFRELADLRRRRAPLWQRALARTLRGIDPVGRLTRPWAELARELAVSDRCHGRALALVEELAGLRVPPAPPSRLMSGVPEPVTRARPGARI